MVRIQLPRRAVATRFAPSLARDMDQLSANIRRMFENPFLPAAELFTEVPQPLGWMPPVEIRENDQSLTITAELPGMERKDVHVAVDGDTLTIRGEKQEERAEGGENEQYHLMERSYGLFHRSFTLPEHVDTANVKAEFAKGVLTIQLPKLKEARARGREIEITGQ